MKDREFQQHIRRIRKVANYWSGLMGISSGWKVVYHFERERIPEVNEGYASQGLTCAASCHARWAYLEADITFNVAVMSQFTEKELRYTVVHELCHILVNEMRAVGRRDLGSDHEERVVSQMAWAFIWTRRDVLKEAARAKPQEKIRRRA